MRPKKPSGVRRAAPAKPRARARKPARIVRSLRTRKVVRTHRPASASIAAASKSETGPSPTANAWALALGAAGVVAVGLLIGLPSDDRSSVALEPVGQGVPTQPALPAMSAAPAMTEPAQALREPAQPAPQTVVRAATANATVQTTPTPAVATPTVPERMPAVEPAEPRPSAAPVVAARFERSAEPVTLVTITGCLETDDERFRLNDTTGSDAPKSRSWKSGFLRKRPAPIDVQDASGVGLPAHVGERVSLTGTLVDRNMHVRSLHRISTSCE